MADSTEAKEQFEYLKVPAMALPTVPPDQFWQVKHGWDYVRHATMGLAVQRLLRDGIPGDMAEAGVWRGDCARFIHMFAPDRRLYLFDTFEGFPDEHGQTGGDHDQRFRDTSEAVVRQVVGDSPNVIIRKGFFPATAAGLEHNRFAFVSLDMDTFESIVDGFEFFYPRMSRGGFIFVHDFNATEYEFAVSRACRQFLADKPELLIELPDQWGSAVLRKS